MRAMTRRATTTTCPRCGGHLTTDTHGAVAIRQRYCYVNATLWQMAPRPAVIETCDRCEFAREKGDDR